MCISSIMHQDKALGAKIINIGAQHGDPGSKYAGQFTMTDAQKRRAGMAVAATPTIAPTAPATSYYNASGS